MVFVLKITKIVDTFASTACDAGEQKKSLNLILTQVHYTTKSVFSITFSIFHDILLFHLCCCWKSHFQTNSSKWIVNLLMAYFFRGGKIYDVFRIQNIFDDDYAWYIWFFFLYDLWNTCFRCIFFFYIFLFRGYTVKLGILSLFNVFYYYCNFLF